jgi:hypothetical protein
MMEALLLVLVVGVVPLALTVDLAAPLLWLISRWRAPR